MEYAQLAEELLNLRVSMSQMRIERRMSKLAKGEMFVINYLGRHENSAYPKDLSRNMDVSTARIATILNHLEMNKLVTRTVDSHDNRQIIVSLTRSGIERYRQYRADMLSSVEKMLASLGENDAKEYVRLQKKLVQTMDMGE